MSETSGDGWTPPSVIETEDSCFPSLSSFSFTALELVGGSNSQTS